jgi:type IV secretory pathway TraG/TraD family ATPase VirD4
MGAIGSGKSALIRQALVQIRARGETAIVYDPHGEYLPRFYRPDEGDIVLNPLDARCPYWVPGEEVRSDPEALAMAQALFVDSPGDQRFFTTAAREIFAFLLMRHSPTAAELVSWMTYGDTLDEMLKDTPLAAYIHNTAPPQRTAVMATLTGVARTLETLPREDNGAGCWSAAGWAAHRRGWIFLTSTPQTRARLIPLQSLWLDMLILRLMDGATARASTWFVLDEVASLHRLPQLHTAITENRKYNNPMILGCQGMAQLESRYGQDAKTMLAQPATKILLRIGEPEAAEWASKAIGEQETERLTESRRDNWGISWDHSQLTQQRQMDRLVLASEFQGLADLQAYVKLGNTVAALRIDYWHLPATWPAFVPRVAAEPVRVQPRPSDVSSVVQSLL